MPPGVVTDIFPVVPPTGASTTSDVRLALFTVAAVPLNLTVLSDVVVLKPFPEIVIMAPALPEEGLMELIVGACVVGVEFLLQLIRRKREKRNRVVPFIQSSLSFGSNLMIPVN